MHVEQWQALGVVCGALLALLALLGQVQRKVVRPVWRSLKNAAQLLEQLTGDKAKGIPSLMDQLGAVARNQREQGQQLAEHLEWHGHAQPQVPTMPVPQPANKNGGRGDG